MPLFTEQQLRARAQAAIGSTRLFSDTPSARAKSFINESRRIQLTAPTTKTYDIFLSHSTTDSEQVLGLKLTLEDLKYSVYIDWIEDPQLDRSNVTKATAHTLRERMKSCKSLFYAFSENTINSKWMPWELGYFDGLKQKAAILPITSNTTNNSDGYTGTEYLGIYYYIVVTGGTTLYVHETASKFTGYDTWIKLNINP